MIKNRFLLFSKWCLFSNMLFISLSHSFFPRASAAEAGNSGPLGPSYGPDTPPSHRHHCCPTQRDGFPASSDKALCHYPTHHTVSVWVKGEEMQGDGVYFVRLDWIKNATFLSTLHKDLWSTITRLREIQVWSFDCHFAIFVMLQNT